MILTLFKGSRFSAAAIYKDEFDRISNAPVPGLIQRMVRLCKLNMYGTLWTVTVLYSCILVLDTGSPMVPCRHTATAYFYHLPW